MDEAARLAPELSGPTWIMAQRQTAGRARRGRHWIDPAGNFAATLVMRPAEAPMTRALRSFVAALALYDALTKVIGDSVPLSLKWPNDVLLNGGKLAGILLESGARDYLAVGVGVNLLAAPAAGTVEAGSHRPVSLHDESGTSIAPLDFLDLLAPAFARWERQLTEQGFAPLRKAWLARAAHLGDQITVRAGNATWHGRLETLDEHGALVLHTPDGRRTITAGEVFF